MRIQLYLLKLRIKEIKEMTHVIPNFKMQYEILYLYSIHRISAKKWYKMNWA